MLAAGALLAGLTVGCSAERKGPVARAYHNLTARDNGYFMAREKVKDVEATLLKNMVSDYNKVLPVLPPLSEATVAAVNADLEDIVKKASLPIARHKSSSWTDDSYLIIGKARYYKMEFEEAEKVFRYVNTTGKEPNVRHSALIWLMRTYIQLKQIDNAVAVSDLLKKERGQPENARDLFLTRAQLALIRQEPDTAIVNLRLAIPEVPTKNERSRLRFILGQLYQQKGQDQLAYDQYRKILRRNPPYELDLFTKLNLAQVTQLSDASGKARIDKYLARLLKDFKNLEYRDKIYYEMARLEYRQQHYPKALELLNKSVRASTATGTQKPYSYLLAAQINYDKLRNYRQASRYYDSAVQVLPPTAVEYPAALDRKEVLADFTKQLDIVERQDSLQELARLDTVELNRRLTAMINVELDKREAEAKKAAALAEAAERSAPADINPAAAQFGTQQGAGQFGATNTTGLDLGAAASGAVWYFDNPAALGTARADFIRRWGNRTIQDNWRYASLSQRNPGGGGDKTNGLADGAKGDSAAAQSTAAAEQTAEQARAAAAAQLRTTLVQDLPKTPEDFKTSDALIEEALFQLARIYDERLREPEYAIERYEELLSRFPQTNHGPEALYALYLLAQRSKDTEAQRKWATQLRQKYPKTEYAQLVDDPDYRQKAQALNARIHILYDSAYALYRDGLYPKSRLVIAGANREFPVNDISDKLALLDAVLVGYTAPPATYKAALTQFTTDYTTSPLIPRAQELLAALAAHEAAAAAAAAPPSATASADSAANVRPVVPTPEQIEVVYSTLKSGPHMVLVVYPSSDGKFARLNEQMSDFNSANYSSSNLKVTSLLFDDNTSLVMIKGFEDSRAAMLYAKRQRGASTPLARLAGAWQLVVISTENLPKLYQSRDLQGYQAFYQQTYEQP